MNLSNRYLTKSEMTRSGQKLYCVKKIVLGELEIYGSSAIHARNYIESLSRQQDIYLSYHYIIDSTGKILGIIPENEIAYSTTDVSFNMESIGICLIPENENGDFSKSSIESQVELVNILINKYNLKTSDILTCYDVNMRRIPRRYIDNLISMDYLKKLAYKSKSV